MRELELLAPARNLECGIAAIDHGADAVYIGPERFGARAAAGNSIEDIRQLCTYAHRFSVKIYATVNTILYDDELDATEHLLWQLYETGVDAVLVQDMGILRMKLPPLSFHASTQTDNRTAEKVRWLQEQGFQRVVLARELSVDEIAAVHAAVPDMPLEVFVHGALCVSYSGQCYASQHCFGRSANRGACAQFCRMAFDLLDADGQVIEHDRYLLSLKDLNQSGHLEELIRAGATSFKIEGRLKDVSYVKNVTAAYSERLNDIVSRYPDKYRRASLGRCTYTFEPDLKKTFNRGYTTYFLHGRQLDIFSPDTPKAMGEFVGKVKEIRGSSFTVAGTARFANGDGLCYIYINNERARKLEGFRVNRVEGNRLFPQQMPHSLRPGMALYRNNDMAFERLLSKPSAERKIPITMRLDVISNENSDEGFVLDVFDEHGSCGSFTFPIPHEQANTPQREHIARQLSKLGGTPFVCTEVKMPNGFNFFIPASKLAEMRRLMVEALLKKDKPREEKKVERIQNDSCLPSYRIPYLYNISNHLAREFYRERGLTVIEPAFEQQNVSHLSREKDTKSGREEVLLMQCRHCLRYSLGYCSRQHRQVPWHEPLSLRLGDGRRFRLEFDCRNCQMNVLKE